MSISRRRLLALAAGAAGLPALVGFRPDPARSDTLAKLVADFTRGKAPARAGITLNVPSIAENGNNVPLSFSVESPMTADDHVESVIILADGNPALGVAIFTFTPRSGRAAASIRIRLARTQTVHAFARMSDGRVVMDQREVEVTIGGCGG